MALPMREYFYLCSVGDEVVLIEEPRNWLENGKQQGPFIVTGKHSDHLEFVLSNQPTCSGNRVFRVGIRESYFVHIINSHKASEPIKPMEGLKSMFTNLFTNEPEKTFKKAGIIRDGGFLTEDGKEIFLAYLLKTSGEDFKTTVVDEIVKQLDKK